MGLGRSTLMFASGTLLSRIIGLIRERVVLAVFGSSEAMSGFVIAFRIPNMLRELLAEGALGNSFTKVYSAVMAEDKDRGRRLLMDALVLVTLVSLVVCGLGIIVAPWIVDLLTAESERSSQAMVQIATGLTRLMFPFLGFMAVAAVVMGALHQKGRFFLTAVAPVFFNIFNIVGALVLAGVFESYGPDWIESVFAPKGITGFTVGVLLGGLAQMSIQFIGVVRDLLDELRSYQWRLPWSEDLKKVVILMWPMVIAASAGQVNVAVNTSFATSVSSEAVVWLYSAFRLLHFPIGVFGVAIGVAVLPALARSIAKAKGKINAKASREIQVSVEMVLWFMMPCFVFFLVNHTWVVQFLLQAGNYSAADSEATGAALFAYSFSLITYGLSKVMTSFYFAMERTKFALRVSLISIVVNFCVNWLLVHKFGYVGLAYGYSVTQGISVLLLIWGMHGHGVVINRPRLARCIAMMTGAGIVTWAAMYFAGGYLYGVETLADKAVWIRSGSVVLVNGMLCVGIFAGAGLWYLGQGPKRALAMLLLRKGSG